MKSNRKILFLARWYPDRYDPMPGLFIKRHAEVAADFNDTALLYLRAAPEKPMGFEIDHVIENQIFTVRVYYGTNFSTNSTLRTLLSALQFIRAFFKGYGFIKKNWGIPEITHVNVLTRLGLLALWLKIFSGIKYVITEHWSRYLPSTGSYKGFFRKIATKAVVSNAEAVSTVSLNLAEAMQSHGLKNRHYLVLPNVVDTEAYNIVNLTLLSEGETLIKEAIASRPLKRLLHISCFEDKSKNISGLLRVISKLATERNDFECVMVGDGADFQRMKRLASILKLDDKVIFTGLLEGSALINTYKSSDFMVMFSNYENMPVVISESFACGLPVIATSVGGIPEYVNPSNGILVAPGDETALLDSISFLLDHYKDYDRNVIRNSAVSIFGKDAIREKLAELYSFAINE